MTDTTPERPNAPEPYPQASGQAPLTLVPKTNTLAIVSLVSAFFVSLAAVITGHLALGQIKRRGESGRGLAIAGLILGYAGLAATAIGVVLCIVFAAAFGSLFRTAVAEGGFAGATSAPSAPRAGLPAGTVGAAHFDDGYLAVGAGAQTVDVYFDPMCPYCGQFEQTNGEQLAGLVADGTITLRLHSLTFLDQASQGTAYSTRASAALTCQATLNPAATLGYLAALFANQPAEGSEGRSDEQLVALAGGGSDIAGCVASGDYRLWSQVNTEQALSGPIPGADITSIEGTPTVLVNGGIYSGSLTDPQGFAAFLGAHSNA
jgi:protein-disulfide isomerase